MDLKKSIGLGVEQTAESRRELLRYINLKLAALGQPVVKSDDDESTLSTMIEGLLSHHRESARLLANYLPPADWRIQRFLEEYLGAAAGGVKLPSQTLSLDRHGIARELSLPAKSDYFRSDIVESYRLKQGALHNPKSDRRTTKGSFHIAAGGLPVPDDKIEVPEEAFAELLKVALDPPRELLQLPITSDQEERAELFVSLLLRPIVCPEVAGYTEQKTMEVRFFVPGNLVGNLDFVESIFGNAGDPYLPENDAGLDVEHWTGHTGCVILAPHLITVKKKDLGLPKWEDATERQRRDGVCWKSEDEIYNDGLAFKITCRDERGVMVTIIADNYFGYCKKEVKTQIGYAANLSGLGEEEHAGGALVYPSYDLGEAFYGDRHVQNRGHNFEEVKEKYGAFMDLQPEGYGIDKTFPDILYVSEKVHFDLNGLRVSWPTENGEQGIKLLPGKTYVRPSGYKVRMEKPPGKRAWRLVGTGAEPTLCHKPCTVSGGGKSEISKPITDAIIQGAVFVADFQKDFDEVEKLIERDYSDRFRDKARQGKDSRKILSPERSLGSVVKLLTPAPVDYTDEYNAWLETIPAHIKELVFVVKRFHVPGWGDDWRPHFSVDVVDGTQGNTLKLDDRALVSNFLRVGFAQDGSWRVFGLRKDFHAAEKQSQEDDITASVVVPAEALEHLNPDYAAPSVKFVQNCEYRFFQRPDDAIHRGYDKQTEWDFAQPGNFVSNYQPLTPADAKEIVEDAIGFVEYTEPMRNLIQSVADEGAPSYFVATSHPRIVDGKPSKNPRYLQVRPDLLTPREVYLMEMSTRLKRRMPADAPVHTPVNATLPGRRNNPPDSGIRPLAVYNPIHYMELPELFMEFICSMTGKSPSTTGAGSEGAMTKGPFNALLPIHDLNSALVAFLLTGHNGFVTAAGYVGPHVRVDHDISMLIPELWCRMTVDELDPQKMIEGGFLEKCVDVAHKGEPALASRLGYRITRKFVRTYFGRIFHNPHKVITEEMLKPELQDMEIYVEGMANIVETQQRVANLYFADRAVELACPPLEALLHIMRDGQFEGKGLDHPEIRELFTRENMLASEWYAKRLAARQSKDIALWERHEAYLNEFLAKDTHKAEAGRLGIRARLESVGATLDEMRSDAYAAKLQGTIGAAPKLRL